MQMMHVRLDGQVSRVVFMGAELCVWDGGEDSTEEARTPAQGGFLIFPAGHPKKKKKKKVLVTAKQFNHCFDNSDTPTHSGANCRTWTFHQCDMFSGFIMIPPRKKLFFLHLLLLSTVYFWPIISGARQLSLEGEEKRETIYWLQKYATVPEKQIHYSHEESHRQCLPFTYGRNDNAGKHK